MIAAVVMQPYDSLEIASGKRTMTLKTADLEYYEGTRGRRGNMLPRGWRKVDSVKVLPETKDE